MSYRSLQTLFIMTTLTGLVAGCSALPTTDKFGANADQGGKEDRWDRRNDPGNFSHELEYELENLPREGRAEHESWPSTYWPTYEDSINHRWISGELSPAEKYDQAFNGWEPAEGFMELRPFSRNSASQWDESYYDGLGPLASHISHNMGNGRDRQLSLDAENGMPEEWDVETWWGLCHAWVPAAMNEERPLRTVEYNGIDFHVADLEALLIAAYNRAPAAMLGGRCNAGHGDEDRGNAEVERDENGRAVNSECRDTNPGSFHVIMTNYLGIRNEAYAEDRTYDYEVWNQPVVAYEVTKLEEINVARANELLGLTGDDYQYNADAEVLYEVNASTTYITESDASREPADASRFERTDRYTYILELDGAGKIIGGEWTGSSRSDLPDFLWSPSRLTRSSVAHLDLDKIRMLVRMSRQTETGATGATGEAVTVEGAGSVEIPDNDAGGISQTVTVDADFVVGSVTVDLDISHTYVGDLTVALLHDGEERAFYNRVGGSGDDVRDSFVVPGFSGASATGEWTLRVVDNANLDKGSLNAWRITVAPGDGDVAPSEPGTGGVMTFDGEGSIEIPDNDQDGITSQATVPSGTTGQLEARVDIAHTYRGDLRVVLSNGEQSFTLSDREGGSADGLVNTFPVDVAGDLGGSWTLTVSDRANADTGTLNSWALVVRPGA